MYLTKYEEKLLNGERGEIYAKAISAIIKVGEAMGAERLIEISHAHVSGLSYATIGEPGLLFIKSLAEKNARVSVYSTLNPIGMDLEDWEKFGISREFAEKQKEIVNYILKMGFDPTFTCTPYLIRVPQEGEHLSWGESSAVGMANTYYGAHTNREGGPLALMSALVGRTYEAGLHIFDNRIPTHEIVIELKNRNLDTSVWGAVGYLVGDKVRNGIPLIREKYKLDFESVKAYTAAAGASGDIAMSVIEGITPRYKELIKKSDRLERIFIEEKEVDSLIKNESEVDPDALFVGCPHADLDEILNIYHMIESCKRLSIPLIISTSRYVLGKLKELGIDNKMAEKGVVFVRDTCPVVSPFIKGKFKNIATTSSKSFFYIPRVHGTDIAVVPFQKIGDIVCKKRR